MNHASRPNTSPMSGDASAECALDEAWQRTLAFFEQLTSADLQRLDAIYTSDARFKDPFHEVTGTAAIQAIFARMFDQLVQPRFVITDAVRQGTRGFVTWDFVFARPQQPTAWWTIRGATHLVLREEDGVWRVAVHRDYWDAAEELYEKLPLLGAAMRWLKRRAGS